MCRVSCLDKFTCVTQCWPLRLTACATVQGELSGEIHKIGIVESEEFLPDGSHISARVPVPLAMRLAQFAVGPKSAQQIAA